ncbi:hypothetical protein F4775DRAFT_552028 [Biscogniauxia sp. FL1348]|nr:hypothetical protein F4775DRAFT_552028 [Biscogniauxia sp. FL1348]
MQYRYIQELGLPNKNNQFIVMWKRMCKVLKVAPTDVVGPTKHLVYDVKTVDIKGFSMPDPNWGAVFCIKLTHIAIGGPCGDDAGLLAFFVRYAVTCRLNDRDLFPILGLERDCTFFKLVGDKLEKHRDPRVSLA